MIPSKIKALAVDADIVAYRCAAVCDNDQDAELYRILDEFLFNIVRNTQVTKLILCISDKRNFRYDVAKTQDYKGNRKSIVRPSRLSDAKEYLIEQYNALIVKNFEADDIIASAMTNPEIAHAGIDKDIKQVPGWHYNFVKNTWDHVTEEEAMLLLYRQVCTGDTSDNIPGLKGVGPKTAEKWVYDPDIAKDQALELYADKLIGWTEAQVKEYFSEQESLIELVTTLAIPVDHMINIEPPGMFMADEEGDFMGFEEVENTTELDNAPEPINLDEFNL